MMKLLRHSSQTVLVLVLAAIGLGFLFYGSSGTLLNSPAGQGNSDTGEINGTNVNYADLQNAVRDTRNSIILNGQGELLKQPGGTAQLAQEAWKQMLLLAEADKLHINPSDQQIIEIIRGMSQFQDKKTGQFSLDAYRDILQRLQPLFNVPPSPGPDPLQATGDAFARVIKNNLRIRAVYSTLFGTIRGTGKDIAARYNIVGAASQVSFVTFDPKPFADAAQVSDAEVEAAYKAHPEDPAFRSKEKRKVDYVLFMLTPDQVKLPEEEKRAAKNELGEKAIQLAMACLPEPSEHGGATPAPPADFVTEAKKEGLNPATTEFFTSDTPPANVPPSSAFNTAAFDLTKDNTVSKVIDLENGVAVMHLAEIQPSDLLPLNEVKAQIIQELKKEKGIQAEGLAAAKTAEALKAEIAKGTDFKTATAAMKLKVETLPPITPLNVTEPDERTETIAYVVTTLSPGQVSGPVPTGDNNILILHLDSRDKPDPAGFDKFEANYHQSEDQQLRRNVDTDWVLWASKQPGTRPPAQLEAYGGLE